MKVNILSKSYFESQMKSHNITDDNVESFNEVMFISILNTDDVGDNIGHFKNNHSNVLVLKFDDVEVDLNWEEDQHFYGAKAFTEDQAKEIINFITQNKHKKNCIVHCSAGISRSGAVGTFISDYFRADYKEFKKRNPYIHPNGLVLRTLKNLTYNYE